FGFRITLTVVVLGWPWAYDLLIMFSLSLFSYCSITLTLGTGTLVCWRSTRLVSCSFKAAVKPWIASASYNARHSEVKGAPSNAEFLLCSYSWRGRKRVVLALGYAEAAGARS